MLSRSVSFMSQLIRNLVLIISQIWRVPKCLRLNCEGSATGSRRFRDTRDDFETILRGILSHKIFDHVQTFCDYFAPLGDTCEEITSHWRLFPRLLCDPLAISVASCRKTVAVQWDRGLRIEIHILSLHWTLSQTRSTLAHTNLLPFVRCILGLNRHSPAILLKYIMLSLLAWLRALHPENID